MFKENEHLGKSGYYYVTNDSVFIEIFGGNGLGYGYWYYQSSLAIEGELRLDSNNWYYREPKRTKKHKLIPSVVEKQFFDFLYIKDTIQIFDVYPRW